MTAVDQLFQQTPPPEDDIPKAVPRDRWGRPQIITPDGKGRAAYTRASTLAKTLDDGNNLMLWKARMAARGVAMRPDLLALFASFTDLDDPEQKKEANKAAETAADVAGSTKKRTIGTAFHAFTEFWDKNHQLPPHVPEGILRTLLTNYIEVTRPVRWLAFEQFVVVDEIGTAGTADRVGLLEGQKPRIWDIKSGRVDYGQIAFAIQLATYAHGRLYNPQTGDRASWPAMDLEVGIILHADQDTGEVQPYEVDIAEGWRLAKLAIDIRAWRKKARGLMHPISLAAPTTTPAQLAAAATAPEETVKSKTIMQRLSACVTLEDLNAVYAETGADWEDRHKTFAGIMANDIREGKTAS